MGISVEPSATSVLVEDVNGWPEARVIPLYGLAWVAEDLRQLPCPCTLVIRGPLASWGCTEVTMASIARLLQGSTHERTLIAVSRGRTFETALYDMVCLHSIVFYYSLHGP